MKKEIKKVSLLFGIHMHQPVDNFGESVDEAIALCYGPFFETMVKFSDFKFAVHCSGWLLEQIKEKQPDIFKNMQILTKKGSIEWISAGYYEPVLSAIPSRDRQGQIKKLNTYIKKNLKTSPQGLWLTERVWESSLIPDLYACDIDYAVVDDYHFLSSGFSPDAMDGYYETEEGGYPLALFPISQPLRYALPFYSVERSIQTILDCAHEKDSAAIIFDDAEKFGLWPKTHEWVYEKKWLERFVRAVLDNEAIVTQHYSEYLKNNRSRGIAYLNNVSYFEMGEWSLRAKQTLALEALKEKVGSKYFDEMGVAFIKGGIWKNFFIKYTESNYLHKRMLSHSVNQDKFDKNTMDSLYKLQTNDVFWHGVFGGLYLPNLRDNAYTYLLQIEKTLAKKSLCFEVSDIDKDGYDELKVLSQSLCTVFSSRWGGQMVECGCLEVFFNWQNTLMRREEAYHDKILHPKEVLFTPNENSDEIATIHGDTNAVTEDLKAELIYDWHPKHSFIDHFSPSAFNLEDFRTVTFREVGDFANQAFELNAKTTTFSRKGGIYVDKDYPTTLKKQYTFKDSSIALELTCMSEFSDTLYYAQECNFHLAHPDQCLLNGEKIEDGWSSSDTSTLDIIDTFTQKKLTLTCNQKCSIYAYILKTVSQSESGFDTVAQQISLIFSLPFKTSLKLKMNLEISNV